MPRPSPHRAAPRDPPCRAWGRTTSSGRGRNRRPRSTWQLRELPGRKKFAAAGGGVVAKPARRAPGHAQAKKQLVHKVPKVQCPNAKPFP
eukprot:11201061-Alexandrium_andersonii.AAC.1